MLVSRSFQLRRAKMLSFLDELEASAGEAKSLYIPPGLRLSDVKAALGNMIDISAIEEVVKAAVGSETGAVIFWGSVRRCLVLPPFPVAEKRVTDGYDVETLRSLLKRELTIALVLVRLGSYAVGVCRSERLVSSKVGTGLVHARHRQGGSSQGRFARHREKQIECFLGRICQHAHEQLEPYARSLDHIVFGGARTTILLLQKRCPFLSQFDNRRLPLLLTIPEPRQSVLESAITDVWSSWVTEWNEKESPD